ncbi:MAG: VOC family protein [Spirochaetes bacterium]|nr:VOC family protein [Spirochaetota bacterium]
MIFSSNTILYCKKWKECVFFYREILRLQTNMEKDWFIEFKLHDKTYLSIANESRASVKSAGGEGITLALKYESAEKTRSRFIQKGIDPGEIRNHPWGGRSFFITDPEGVRIEIWSDK